MPQTEQNNIILIVNDDLAQWALGCYGNAEIHTPTLDYLAATGVLMENAFTPTPVCSPARACLLTGRLASQHGIHDYLSSTIPEIHRRPWLKDEVTLAQLLSRRGLPDGALRQMASGQRRSAAGRLCALVQRRRRLPGRARRRSPL